MNNSFIRLLLFISFFGGIDIAVFGQDVTNITDKNGLKQGAWNKKDALGNLVYTGSFKDNKPNGEFIYYDSIGKVKARSVFSEDGTKAFTILFQNDRKVAEGNYIKEKKDGIWKFYNADSIIIAEELYKNGIPEGAWKTYYNHGTVLDEVTYKNGKKEGPWRQYFPDGLIKTVGTYRNSKLEGLATFYHPNGRVFISGPYVNNLKDGEWLHFNDQGIIEKREDWSKGVLIKEQFYNKDQERMMKEEK